MNTTTVMMKMMSTRRLMGARPLLTVKRMAAARRRSFGTRRSTKHPPLPTAILDALPVFDGKQDSPPKKYVDPNFQNPNNPVTSAHCIDVEKQELSTLDSAAIRPDGTIVHGRYGDLGPAAAAIPLEYLALLFPAAEGAAALRVLGADKTKGTLLVFGASQASGMAATQIGSSMGHAVVAVVDGQHSGNDDMVECIKGLIAEPGTALPEEYALSKGNFANLVRSISTGDEGIATPTPEEYLEEFKVNFLDQCEAYPDTRPAAVSAEHMEFNYMEKDREYFEENMEAYLEQFPPGAPPMDKAKLDAFFSTEQYEIFREKFWTQTTNVISGDDTPAFSPPHLVKRHFEKPETLDHRTYSGAGPYFPYSFSILNQAFPEGTEAKPGGPIMGAIIVVTPTLKKTAEAVAKATTVRGKAEALQFLSKNERATFGAACSVAAQATKAKAPVVVVGGTLPGMKPVEATEADVKEALSAMDIDENGESRLNYFVQAFRANNFPFYGDYAIHRASEPLAGPRQLIVTK